MAALALLLVLFLNAELFAASPATTPATPPAADPAVASVTASAATPEAVPAASSEAAPDTASNAPDTAPAPTTPQRPEVASSGEHPLDAWGRIRFGMNPAQVGAIVGRFVSPLETPGRFTHQIDGEYRGYRMAFTFFGARGLERVALIDAGLPGLDARLRQIEELLVLKYGAPFNRENRDEMLVWEWITPYKLVQLMYRGGRTPLLHVVYTWRKSAMVENY